MELTVEWQLCSPNFGSLCRFSEEYLDTLLVPLLVPLLDVLFEEWRLVDSHTCVLNWKSGYAGCQSFACYTSIPKAS